MEIVAWSPLRLASPKSGCCPGTRRRKRPAGGLQDQLLADSQGCAHPSVSAIGRASTGLPLSSPIASARPRPSTRMESKLLTGPTGFTRGHKSMDMSK